MTGLKNCKSCQENVSLSLAKRKLAEKMNGSFLMNQVRSCMLPYTSQITEEAYFFRLTYLEHNFMIANLIRLNLTVLRPPRNTPVVECYISKIANIHSPI